MEKLLLSENQKKLVEKFGVVFENSGLTPAQARIAGLLIIADKVELTFDEIKDTLQLSKSATSNGINALLLMEQIIYTTKIGDRKRYFKSKIASMEGEFERKIKQMLQVRVLFEEILQSRTSDTPEFNLKLAKMIDFMSFMDVEMPKVYEKWKSHQNR